MRFREKVSIVPLTRKLAREHAALESLAYDRPYRSERAEFLEREIQQGRLHAPTWARAYCKETGKWYRVNGQHTSKLLQEREIIPTISVVLKSFEVDTLSDVSDLFATFDPKQSARSIRDIHLSFSRNIPTLDDIPDRTLCLAIGAVNLYRSSASDAVMKRGMSAENSKVIQEPTCQRFTLGLDKLTGRKNTGKLRKLGVCAAMYGTWQRDEEAADKFWTLVRDETGQSPTDPDRKLATFLATHTTRDSYGTGKRITQRELYARCILHWNAWRTGRPVAKWKPDADLPDVK